MCVVYAAALSEYEQRWLQPHMLMLMLMLSLSHSWLFPGVLTQSFGNSRRGAVTLACKHAVDYYPRKQSRSGYILQCAKTVVKDAYPCLRLNPAG